MLTCENHPDLRWHCKMQAVSRSGRYTGARNIFFSGKVLDSGELVPYGHMHNGEVVRECPCPGSALIATDMDYVKKWHEENKY